MILIYEGQRNFLNVWKRSASLSILKGSRFLLQ